MCRLDDRVCTFATEAAKPEKPPTPDKPDRQTTGHGLVSKNPTELCPRIDLSKNR